MEDVIRRADIVVAAVGKTELVKGSWLKPGAVVIDVGINSKDDPTKKAGRYPVFCIPHIIVYYLTLHLWLFVCAYIGYRLVGDVDFDDCKAVASKITPVRLIYPPNTHTSFIVY